MAGGKSRKTGGVSKALINRIVNSKNSKKSSSNKKEKKNERKGILDMD